MTNPSKLTTISKFLSLVLRHQPQSIGLHLDTAGWAAIDELLARTAAAGKPLTRDVLQQVVDTSDKQRFQISADGQHIRANQGHSIKVDLGLAAVPPPDVLYHGTAERFLASILAEGLSKRERHHVHLTEDRKVAASVGRRYGQLVLLQVDAAQMARDGRLFFRSDNNVWLTDAVPPHYLQVLR
ncbi:RNA 2'-phosphotransferase [Caldimonas brevitalea]|uniref:Probable RNA 2'-phosphotransferase n=1 Tax=Caldimonas brevitalea TaxID=413882 RepID=A0A0G3BUQ0_9BURK|nr:RNA 2'-phosphotransferase [Caldimonas brevitalea]AKJ31096.1 RNA 2'-phosphotransferase [Caldimonas brevitalea]